MAEIRSFTLDGTLNQAIYNITVPIKAGSTLLLVNSRVDLNYGAVEPTYDELIKSINVKIGDTITNYYVVDNNDKLNAIKIKIKHNLQTLKVGGVDNFINISDYEPNMAYKIGQDMNTQIEVSIRDDTGALFNQTKLKYYHFQFQVL